MEDKGITIAIAPLMTTKSVAQCVACILANACGDTANGAITGEVDMGLQDRDYMRRRCDENCSDEWELGWPVRVLIIAGSVLLLLSSFDIL